jgi:hypothetical protein
MLSPMKVKIIPITGMIATQPMTSIVRMTLSGSFVGAIAVSLAQSISKAITIAEVVRLVRRSVLWG